MNMSMESFPMVALSVVVLVQIVMVPTSVNCLTMGSVSYKMHKIRIVQQISSKMFRVEMKRISEQITLLTQQKVQRRRNFWKCYRNHGL